MIIVEFSRDHGRRMKALIIGLVLCSAVFFQLCLTCLTAFASAETMVTAAQVNGTWKSGGSTFKVLALGKQKLKVEFFGTYEYESQWGPTANTGEASGIAIIKGDTAIFKPDVGDKSCEITMKFTEGKLIVKEEGLCPFGFNVSSQDTYLKVSKKKPKFNE